MPNFALADIGQDGSMSSSGREGERSGIQSNNLGFSALVGTALHSPF